MSYFSTSTFEEDVAKLIKKPKYGYSGCRNDIAEIFKVSFDDLIQLDERVLLDGKIMIRKIRVPNKEKHEGKSGGYRVIAIVDLNQKNNSFMYAIPQTWSFGI